MKNNKNILGIVMAVATGGGWGLSGVFSQYLFSNTSMKPEWFVAIRMLIAGSVLLIAELCMNKSELIKLIHNKKDLAICMIAGIVGTMMFQISCYSAVKESNAPTAIVLQYLCPVMIISYVCVSKKKLPRLIEVISIIFAITGIFIISTHGDVHTLVLTPKALILGIGSAFFMSLGSIIPEKMYEKYSVQSITAVMLFSGGVVAAIFTRPWSNIPGMNKMEILFLTFAILIGGVFTYVVYALAIKYIGSAKASLCACVEIPIATILAVVWLGSSFHYMDLIGFILITSTIFLSAVKKKEALK